VSVDVRLIAILDPAVLGARDPAAAARAAAFGGATILQVRAKTLSARALLALVERVAGAVDVPVYVNDRADVAWAAGAAGVHVGADDVPAVRLRAVAPRGFRIGVSVGDAAEAELVRDAAPDYWSIGAVFATGSKSDAGTPIGPEGFRRVAMLAPAALPLVAIGGITASNAPAVIAAGADGVAVIRAVFGAPDIAAAAEALRTAVDAARATR